MLVSLLLLLFLLPCSAKTGKVKKLTKKQKAEAARIMYTAAGELTPEECHRVVKQAAATELRNGIPYHFASSSPAQRNIN